MPRFSIGRGALNGAASGGARLVQAIMGADKAYQDGYDRSALSQARLAQSEASADKSEASAAQTGAEARILESRPDVFNETLAARANVPVPQVQAYRNYLNTGVMPERQLPGPPTEQGIGPGSAPLVDESAGGRIRALLGQMGLLQGNVKDVNPAQLADADSTYRTMGLGDDVLAGRREAAPVAEAQRAAKGSDLFKQAGNGSVLDVTTGQVDQTNPIATATVGVKTAQANKAATGGGKASAGPMDDTKKAQAAILFQELQEVRARKQTAKGDEVARAQADEAAVISELKGLGIKDIGQLTKLPKPAGAAKPPTEGQSKALLFGSRMAVADEILKEMEGRNAGMPNILKKGLETIPGVGGALGMGANFSSTEDQQLVEQARRDFINAVLRRESGAVIGADEFASADQQYFPQPGDSAAVRRQKAANRRTAIEGFKAEIGESYMPNFLATVRGARATRQQQSRKPASGISADQSGNSPVGVIQRNVRVTY